MSSQSCKRIGVIIVGCFFLCAAGISSSYAENISEFVTINPYAEVEGGYDDNVFELADEAPLPDEGEEREDVYINTKAGVNVEVALDRPYLSLGAGLVYDFLYSQYMDNTELDGVQNSLDFDLTFASKIEEQIGKDRFQLDLYDTLSLIPIDEEEPLLPGNSTIRNVFGAGVRYQIISGPRIGLNLGYGYSRTDYEEEDVIEVETVADQFEDSSDLTQESQSHTGTAELEYALNPKLTYVLTYNYGFYSREENTGELVSANFSRQRVLTGIRVKLTPRIHSNLQAGYSLTSYDDVGDAGQDDQDSVIIEADITANFPRQPQMQLGYRRYFVENDFGDTLLTDTIYSRVGLMVMQGFLVNLSGDYIIENRELLDDETTQILLGVDAEYELVKNMTFLASYSYKNKDFFEQNFLLAGDREETTHTISSGLEYKVSRYFYMKGIYSYMDRTSTLEGDDFNRNQFTASGKVVF